MRVAALLMCVLMASSGLAAAAAERPHVVIILIDGFPAYLLDDPQAPIPTLRALARKGTAAAGMRVINPSVTWPNHTTLVTGVRADKHSVLFNGSLVRPGGPSARQRGTPRDDAQPPKTRNRSAMPSDPMFRILRPSESSSDRTRTLPKNT